MSDHRYVRFDVSAEGDVPGPCRPRRAVAPSPRWALGCLNKDILMEASIVDLAESAGRVHRRARRGGLVPRRVNIRDASMPRIRGPPVECRQVY